MGDIKCSICGGETYLSEKTNLPVYCWGCIKSKPISKVDIFIQDLLERRDKDLFFDYSEENLQLIKKGLLKLDEMMD